MRRTISQSTPAAAMRYSRHMAEVAASEKNPDISRELPGATKTVDDSEGLECFEGDVFVDEKPGFIHDSTDVDMAGFWDFLGDNNVSADKAERVDDPKMLVNDLQAKSNELTRIRNKNDLTRIISEMSALLVRIMRQKKSDLKKIRLTKNDQSYLKVDMERDLMDWLKQIIRETRALNEAYDDDVEAIENITRSIVSVIVSNGLDLLEINRIVKQSIGSDEKKSDGYVGSYL